jgi:importin subunit alpha-6/7
VQVDVTLSSCVLNGHVFPGVQYVIEANLIPPLIRMLEVAEFDIRKEAAWALSNATSGGTPVQIRYMVSRGAVAALCGLLGVQDAKIISVALEGLENILRVGEMEREMVRGPINECARMIEECGGAEKLDALENHENHGESCPLVSLGCVSVCATMVVVVVADVYERTNRIQQTYFGGDETTLEGPAPGTATVATVPFAFGVVPPTAPQPGAPAANPFNGAANPFANLAANMPTYR